MTQCTACAFVFSGRPDPTWVVEDQQSKRLEAIWNQLTPCVAPTPPKSRLGYRGVSIVCENNEEYTAFDGHVKKKASNIVKWKKDEKRRFERLLLSTAPKGLLPVEIIKT